MGRDPHVDIVGVTGSSPVMSIEFHCVKGLSKCCSALLDSGMLAQSEMPFRLRNGCDQPAFTSPNPF